MADIGASLAKSEEHIEGTMIQPSDNHSNWLGLVAVYVPEMQDVLDLGGKELCIQDVRYVLNFLRDSQVTELNLEHNYLTNGMAELSSLLIKTKVKKLNISSCGLSKDDLIQLTEVLNKSQITDLDISNNKASDFSFEEALKFVSNLKQSKLTTFNSDFFKLLSFNELAPLFQEFLGSSITNLDLRGSKLSVNDFSFLFESLPQSSVTDLNLQATKIPSEALQDLSCRLASMKIEKLNLSKNNLKDANLEVLAEGLINSKVIHLDLMVNSFSKFGPLFRRLKYTQIRNLNLRYNSLLENETFMYPDFLRDSLLTSLDLRNCNLVDEAREKLIESLRFSNVTKLDISVMNWDSPSFYNRSLTVNKFVTSFYDLSLTDLDLSQNVIHRDHELFKLGKSLKNSRLTRIALNNMRNISDLPVCCLISFLRLMEGSSISRIEMNSSFLIAQTREKCLKGDKCYQYKEKMLANTTFSELELASKEIRTNVSVLLKYLNHSNVTYLNLAENGIRDNSTEALAEFLKKPQLRRLNLNKNLITSEGARTLALQFKNSRVQCLHLNGNLIDNDGIEFLAEHAKFTFITVLDVAQNPGDNAILVEEILWLNKFAVPKVISIFKQIMPQTAESELRFDENFDESDISTFLERCMWLFKTVISDERATNVLLDGTNKLFTQKEIFSMISEKFSLQFTQFIGRVEADLELHLQILEKSEDMALTSITTDLLYNRELYLLDRDKNILHPYVYKLLHKYNMPTCSRLDPEGGAKIIRYFMEHSDIEGSEDVINLLQGV